MNKLVFVFALCVLIWCFMLWNQGPAGADWREAYREGYETASTMPGEDGIRGSGVTVPTPETPRLAETDGEAFARGVLDAQREEN